MGDWCACVFSGGKIYIKFILFVRWISLSTILKCLLKCICGFCRVVCTAQRVYLVLEKGAL